MEAGTSWSPGDALKEPPPPPAPPAPPSTSHGDDDHFIRLSTSSASSSSCSSFDPFQLDEQVNANASSAADDDHLKLEKPISGPSFRFDRDESTPISPLPVTECTSYELAEPSLGRAASDCSLSSSSRSSTSSGSITQSPPVQVMERTGDLDNGGAPAPYRIPSSVFARNPSTTPQEWSVTSNESLFSIHMGNMSFNKDLYWMYKSGELGKSGEFIMSPSIIDYTSNQPPPPLIDHSSNQPPPPLTIDHTSNQRPLPLTVEHPSNQRPPPLTVEHPSNQRPAPLTVEHPSNQRPPPLTVEHPSNQRPPPLTVEHPSNQPPAAFANYSSNPPSPNRTSNIFKTNTNLDEGLRATPEAVETMKAVLRENAEADRDKDNSSHHSAAASPSHRSTASGASTKSFAFPILGGDGGKSGSTKTPGSRRQHSQRPNLEPESSNPPAPTRTQTTKPVDTGQTRWFSCLSCCSFCS